MGKPTLIKPDLKRCQCERVATFMTMGGATTGQTICRCKNKPVVIITEKKKGSDGKRGSMSVCSICLDIARKQMGENSFTETIIKSKKD